MILFFDTNVLIYAFMDCDKRDRARAVLAQGGVISAQVLNEFTNVSRKKLRRDWDDIEASLAVIRLRFPDVLPLTLSTHAAAVLLARDHMVSFYDALIVAAAAEAGCGRLCSEDLQHGRRFGDLEVVNPFIAEPGFEITLGA